MPWDRFARESELLQEEANTTSALVGLQKLADLNALRQASGFGEVSPESGTDRVLQQHAQLLLGALRVQRRTLGVYRQHSNASKALVRGWTEGQLPAARRSVLLTLDRVWWKLRSELDAYIDAADEHPELLAQASEAVAGYAKCEQGLSSAAATYRRAMASRSRLAARLRATWRGSVNLVGELAASVEDGEAFPTLMKEEGCESPLAEQTLRQAQLAVGGMRALLSRFKASGLAQPDLDPLVEAVGRIRMSYHQAGRICLR